MFEAVANGEFDFLDFGASDGKSFLFAQRVLGGGPGLAIDIDEKKVTKLRTAGVPCYQADVTKLDLPENSVRFVIMNHFLEHLPSLEHVRQTISSAAKVASEFIAIQGPYFDADDMLAKVNLRYYWSYWSVHTCHLSTFQLETILDLLDLTKRGLWLSGEVLDSNDPSLHPLSSPKNQTEHDSLIHEGKAKVVFRPPLYREITCLIKSGPMQEWPKLMAKVATSRKAVPIELVRDGRWRKASEIRRRFHWKNAKTPKSQSQLRKLSRILLVHRGWEFLRYLHLREAIVCLADVRSVLIVGSDRGIAGVALAVEFPEIRISIADYRGDKNAFRMANEVVGNWSLKNIRVGGDPLSGARGRFDFVGLVDVLQHAQDPREYVRRLASRSRRWMYVLAPLAEDRDLGVKPISGRDGGLPIGTLRDICPSGQFRGCYWRHRGSVFRSRLEKMSDREIENDLDGLMGEAVQDLVNAEPRDCLDALAVSVLTEL
jgi:hypothetical protein